MKKVSSLLLLLAALWFANTSCLLSQSRTVASPDTWPSQIYETEDFTAPNMTITRAGTTIPGYLFLTPSGNGTTSQAPIIISDLNELIWSGPSGGWVYNDFRVQDVHGEPHLTYWRGNSSATFGHGYGAVHVLNSSSHDVYNICPSAEELDLVTPGQVSYDCYLGQHEALLTDQGTLLATAYNVTTADLSSVGGAKNGWIFDSLFFEIDLRTGKVLFRWRSLDHLSKIPLQQSKYPLVIGNVTFGRTESLPLGLLPHQLRASAPRRLPRQLSSPILVVQTIRGDFNLPPSVYFSWQHDPLIANVTDSSLTITYFNNDNSEVQNGTDSTTGLALSLDLKTQSVTLLRNLSVPSEPIFADSQGSYQPLPNGHALLGYGQIAKTREFNASGGLVYEGQYGYSTATSRVSSYRSYRQSWTAQPATAPKIVAKCAGRTAKVYVSWNGATTYDGWTIYGGNSAGNLSVVASIPKTGFEPEHEFGTQWKYIVAEAKEGSRPLRNTSIVLFSH